MNVSAYRVGRTLRRPADTDALRLLNREQWRQLERDIAEESWTNWYKHLTYFDITDKLASVLTMFWANGLLNYFNQQLYNEWTFKYTS